MSWSSRRRLLYLSGVIIFFVLLIGGPLVYKWIHIPETCHDNKQNHGETQVDRGGPCLLLAGDTLTPVAVSWARALWMREGIYHAVAYISNPNPHAGVVDARYRFRFYDDQNVLIAIREGTISIMPGGVTPIFEPNIETGTRTITRTAFDFTNTPLVWVRMNSSINAVSVQQTTVTDLTTIPRLSGTAINSSPYDVSDIVFVGIVYDTVHNALAASQTFIPLLKGSSQTTVSFTWPTPFRLLNSQAEVIPYKPGTLDPTAER